jgi:hypothetical protein
VKKLRRKKIATHDAVNQYLEQEYCDDHNRRFAMDAASEVDHHLPAPGAKRLREIGSALRGDGAVRTRRERFRKPSQRILPVADLQLSDRLERARCHTDAFARGSLTFASGGSSNSSVD